MAKVNLIVRRLRKDGSVGIPLEYRQVIGLQRGAPVSISVDSAGQKIIIAPGSVTCRTCHKDVNHLDGELGICKECMTKVFEHIGNMQKPLPMDAIHQAIAAITVTKRSRTRA